MFRAKFLLLSVVAALAAAEYEFKPRIVQGHDATRGQFPFYVLLEVRILGEYVDCGSSLISNEWVLTAAHCVHDALYLNVHLGTLRSLDKDEPGRRKFLIFAEDIHVNPEFSLGTILK